MNQTDMRICLVGDYEGVPDEGMKNTARYLADALTKQGVNIYKADVSDFYRFSFFQSIRSFDPHLIHYVPGIGGKNLLLMKLLESITDAETVISAIYPKWVPDHPTLAQLLSPSVVFTQTSKPTFSFPTSECRTVFLPNGVDIDKFRPLPPEEQRYIRSKFDIDQDKFLVIHVGHLTERRGLGVLADLQSKCSNIQVVIAASNHFDQSDALVMDLRSAGIQLLKGYIPNIEELYAISDCYVFPTLSGDTIQTPLSVIEAMACNIPVVTREHPGIRQLFDPGGGLSIEDSDEALIDTVLELKANEPPSETREKVKAYSWENVAEMAIETYQTLHN